VSRIDRFAEGKVPHNLLSALLSRITKPGKEVIIGPEVGEDAFAVGVGRTVLIGTTDPITFTCEHIGYYAVNVNANDVATMGARPRWFLATVLVPPRFKSRALRMIFDEIDKTCIDLGIRLCGGHTEVTSAVAEPVVVGAMLGTVSRKKLVVAKRAREGDVLLLTKRLAIEGTSIIARARRKEVEALLGRRSAARARDLLFNPGMSVVREALCAVDTAPVHAMHDPTEGGVLWGLKEISLATGLGFRVELESIPVYEETRLICKHFKINPLGLIASGSLLIAVSRRDSMRIVEALKPLRVDCSPIGILQGQRARLSNRGESMRLPHLKADEISKVL
jgi:hydrogenase maturation factor